MGYIPRCDEDGYAEPILSMKRVPKVVDDGKPENERIIKQKFSHGIC